MFIVSYLSIPCTAAEPSRLPLPPHDSHCPPPLHISLLPTESFPLQGAAEDPHGPSLDSPSTDCPATLTTARGHIPLSAQRPSMEVSTVSPSPASPTERDDLCKTDVTDVATHSVTLLICLCGLAGNGAVIGLLSLISCNSDMFYFAVIDFLFLLLTVPSTLILLVEDVSCSPILPLLHLRFLFMLSLFSYSIGLLWLIFNSTMLYMCKICWLCCRRELPEHLMPVLISVQMLAFTLLSAVMLMVTFLCGENCQANFISLYTIVLLLFVAPVVVSGTIDFIKAKWGSQQQQPKRRDIVTFLVALFILFLSLWNLLQQLSYITVPSQVVFLLACIHSTIKPFTYFLVGRCWRPCSIRFLQLSLQRVFEEREKTLPTAMIPPWTRGSEPADPFHCCAK